MALQESGEMYLETILVLSKDGKDVRSIDIAESLNISKPAVSKAVAKYKEENLIDVDASGKITLTSEGLRIAEMVYSRHIAITKFLMQLGVSEETANSDACRIEHIISEESLNAMAAHYEEHSNIK